MRKMKSFNLRGISASAYLSTDSVEEREIFL